MHCFCSECNDDSYRVAFSKNIGSEKNGLDPTCFFEADDVEKK